MIQCIPLPLPNGGTVKVMMDSSLPRDEIRVGSLGALDAFMVSTAPLSSVLGPKVEMNGHRVVTRLSNVQIYQAHKWLDAHGQALSEREQNVMRLYFPTNTDTMATTPQVEAGCEVLNISANGARDIRNEVLRAAGILK